MRLTFGEAKNRLAKVLNLCADDPRVIEYANKCCEELMLQPFFVESHTDYQVCAPSACLTWPRCFLTIEAFSICGVPGVVRNGWWEFRGNGVYRFQSNCGCGNTLVDRPSACAFDDVRGLNQKFSLYADDDSDAGKQVLLQYYDQNGMPMRLEYSGAPGAWVRATGAGHWFDGEWITLVAPPAYAFSEFLVMPGGLVGVQKPITNNTVRLYSYDTVTHGQYPLGYYEPSETAPWYRRSMIPGVTQRAPHNVLSQTCSQTQVYVRAKLKFIPVAGDNDWLGIGSLVALEQMAMGVQLCEPGGDESKGLLKKKEAINLLEQELRAHQGSGAVILPKFQSPRVYGAGRIGTTLCWR